MTNQDFEHGFPAFDSAEFTAESVAETHPLRVLFRSVTRQAFDRHRALHHPDVESHIRDEILGDFVHMDRIYRLRDREGTQLTDLSEMALEERDPEGSRGLERDLEIHQYVGDYALFMAGLFPEFIERRRPDGQKPLMVYVGSLLVTMERPADYYIAEGSSAYSYVARMYNRMNSGKSRVFHRLSSRFDEYLELMGIIRELLRDHAAKTESEGGNLIS